jgi:hypothetical protein
VLRPRRTHPRGAAAAPAKSLKTVAEKSAFAPGHAFGGFLLPAVFRCPAARARPWSRRCEVLFLVVCGRIANCDDYDDIVDWGNAHLLFLRGFCEFHYGLRRLASYDDGPGRSGPFYSLLFVLGRAMLAGQAQSWGDRRQDLALQPQSQDRPEGSAPGVSLRHQQPAGAGPGDGLRKIERDHRYPSPPRAPRS